MNKLKMTSASDASKSIVVSFASRWLELLLDGEISVVFRRRGPANFIPDYMYIYVGAPTCALIGRAEIREYSKLRIAEALHFADDGRISESDLTEYSSGYDRLAVFHIGSIQEMQSKLKLPHLHQQYGFAPPQGFFVLSENGKKMLDSVANF